jgi:hypothetical protein
VEKILDSEMPHINHTTVVLGGEFDDNLRNKLLNLLHGLGAIVAGSQGRVVVGSQDIEELDVLINGQVLHVEGETYVGLSIGGPTELVKQIQHAMMP